ncbi:cytosine permease [Erwinia sp. OLTSP20]|uniref:cytosine permease n=1 Tax=unclassified Erwinia TaxID=2622719 RepID=UPI000C192CF9|nr:MULTISPECIES: cytosine permease [unclassified Erwinia]PIJ48436.1 cytosine permease [Erwinia sp. OAMSP11]PIJ65967.1 cytosine permease [Erwinia sp. OLSSP12]PIJ78592.1 cytosine permease [Erwinia sp. OLCASP19]PIJ79066.1 cytosine permease [Erwinia sp. OLMTSP26]PIJ80959.1 cytosine permease [Erwinia sp. OLMDSP33]
MLTGNNYTVSRVPAQFRMPFFGLALIHMGMLTALDQFMLGAVLGHSMTISNAFIAISAGSLLFFIITFGLGYAGMREGLSGSMLARWCGFGRIGSALVGLLIAVSLMGWFGVQNAVFAQSLSFSLGGILSAKQAAALSGISLTLLVACGFRALRFAARIAVPLFIVNIIWITLIVLNKDTPVLPSPVFHQPLTLGAGITLVVGGAIVASLITPDITRYSRSASSVLWMVLLTIFLGEYLVNGLAVFLAMRLNTANVVTIMAHASAGVGLLVVVFSSVRVNDLNLYSSALGVANFIDIISGKKSSYPVLTIIIGFFSTLLSVLGILDRFVDFLTLLGIFFPPVIGVMLTDYFIIRTHRAALTASRQQGTLPAETPLIGLCAITASIAGGLAGYVIPGGVPALTSLLVASVAYRIFKYVADHLNVIRAPAWRE